MLCLSSSGSWHCVKHPYNSLVTLSATGPPPSFQGCHLPLRTTYEKCNSSNVNANFIRPGCYTMPNVTAVMYVVSMSPSWLSSGCRESVFIVWNQQCRRTKTLGDITRVNMFASFLYRFYYFLWHPPILFFAKY